MLPDTARMEAYRVGYEHGSIPTHPFSPPYKEAALRRAYADGFDNAIDQTFYKRSA